MRKPALAPIVLVATNSAGTARHMRRAHMHRDIRLADSHPKDPGAIQAHRVHGPE